MEAKRAPFLICHAISSLYYPTISGAKPTVISLPNHRGDEEDNKRKRYLSPQQKFIKSQDTNEVQRTFCWKGTGDLVCFGRHCAGREVE